MEQKVRARRPKRTSKASQRHSNNATPWDVYPEANTSPLRRRFAKGYTMDSCTKYKGSPVRNSTATSRDTTRTSKEQVKEQGNDTASNQPETTANAIAIRRRGILREAAFTFHRRPGAPQTMIAGGLCQSDRPRLRRASPSGPLVSSLRNKSSVDCHARSGGTSHRAPAAKTFPRFLYCWCLRGCTVRYARRMMNEYRVLQFAGW